jgi:hypothetical protein
MKTITNFLILFVLISSITQAQTTKTWDGGANTTNWSDSTNWNPDGVPGINDNVSFTSTLNISVNLSNKSIGKLQVTNNARVTLTSNGGSRTITINTPAADAISVETGSTLILAGSAFQNNMTLTTVSNPLLVADINGTVRVNGTSGIGIFRKGANAMIKFNADSWYVHSVDGGSIPTAIWDTTSICSVTGISKNGDLLTGTGQKFGNFTFNCPDMDGKHVLLQPGFSTTGIFRITSTGIRELRANWTTSSIARYVQTSGTFTLAAAVARSMNVLGSFTMSGGLLELTRGAQIGTLYVGGNFNHSEGTIIDDGVGSGDIIFNGSNNTKQIFTSGGTVTDTINYTVNSGANLQIARGSTVTGLGTFTLSAGGTLGITSDAGITSTGATGSVQVIGTRTFDPAANYIYNGNVAQNTGDGLPTEITGSLKIENVRGVALSRATNISTGILHLASGVLNNTTNGLTMGNSTSAVNGIISKASGSLSAVPLDANLYTVDYTGDNLSTGNEILGSGLKNITLNMNLGQTVTLTSDLTVSGNLDFISGYIISNTGNKIIIANTGSVSNASNDSYAKCPVQKIGTNNTANYTFVFPTGQSDSLYDPVEITFPLLSTVDAFTVVHNHAQVVPNSLNKTSYVETVNNREYWDITKDVLVDNTPGVDVTMHFLSNTGEITNLDDLTKPNLRIGHYSSTLSQWEIPNVLQNNYVGIVTIGGKVAFKYTVTGVTNFSPFTTVEASATALSLTRTSLIALPVTLTSFTAKPTSTNTVALNWATSSEIVNKGFRIERQAGGVNGKFESIGFVASKAIGGNSQTGLYYNFIDANPRSGSTNYYRLAQENLDGKTNYSEVRVVKLNDETVSTVFPNPSTGAVNISRTGNGKKMNILVIDMAGRMVQQFTNITDSNYKLNISKSGIYNIKITYPETGEQSVQRIVIKN